MAEGYSALCLIPSNAKVSLDQVKSELERAYVASSDQANVRLCGNTISVETTGWSLKIVLNSDSSIVVESGEIAAKFGRGRPDGEIIAKASERFEISTDADPNMDHFNDYVLAIECVEAVVRVISFDPQAGEFL